MTPSRLSNNMSAISDRRNARKAPGRNQGPGGDVGLQARPGLALTMSTAAARQSFAVTGSGVVFIESCMIPTLRITWS